MALKYCEPCCSINQKNPATFLCLDCQEVYCDKCKADHSKFRVLRRHKITKINENNGDNLIESIDQKISFKTVADYVPIRQSLKKRDYSSKLDKKGKPTRSFSLSDLKLSSEEYMYSDTKYLDSEYDYSYAYQKINDFDKSTDQEASFKSGSDYVPFRVPLWEIKSGFKFDRKGTLMRCLSCNDIGLSSDEYVYSDTRFQQLDYEYIEVDAQTPAAVKNVGNLTKTDRASDKANLLETTKTDGASDKGNLLETMSDQANLLETEFDQANHLETESNTTGGISGTVKKTGDPIRTEECVLHEYSVDVEETDLATLIGIQNKQYCFRIYSDKVAFFADSNVYFEATFNTIRTFGMRKKRVNIEFGRKCIHGQGKLYMNSQESQNIHDALNKQMNFKK